MIRIHVAFGRTRHRSKEKGFDPLRNHLLTIVSGTKEFVNSVAISSAPFYNPPLT